MLKFGLLAANKPARQYYVCVCSALNWLGKLWLRVKGAFANALMLPPLLLNEINSGKRLPRGGNGSSSS